MTLIHHQKQKNIRWLLVFYDLIIYLLACVMMFVFHPSTNTVYSLQIVLLQTLLGLFCVFGMRGLFNVYGQIWRYGGVSSYIRLVIADFFGGILYIILNYLLPLGVVEFIRLLSLVSLNLLAAVCMRMVYHYMYEYVNKQPGKASFFEWLIKTVGHIDVKGESQSDKFLSDNQRIKIAIVGAGRIGAALAGELLNNPKSAYIPVAFIDIDRNKIGRVIMGVPVFDEKELSRGMLANMGVQEVVFALPRVESEELKRLYDYYISTGCKVKVYDYPAMQSVTGNRRTLRELDAEELLFRSPIEFDKEVTTAYFTGKTVLITGGGGSIGSELCRQIASMQPKKLVVLDIYENGAYDVQQELKIKYGAGLDMQIEIVSVCDRRGLEQVFLTHHPDIVIHAAAHKHVPLMEHNCSEAVKNNVFGTLNTVELSEQYGVKRFMLVSTDKAVNPTNVMGATKRMCEIIVMAHNGNASGTVYTATRFGNVLGSAGSVIPLFKRQIANGGPVTITDRRIVRYFMTIPEAVQLILESGALAKKGELFCLDMGKPVKILDLAENMIRLLGYEPYKDIQIIETGLRPGEKLYEELLINTETMQKTDNNLIFIEKDSPVAMAELDSMLAVLREAVETENSATVRAALKRVITSYRSPEEINSGVGGKDLH